MSLLGRLAMWIWPNADRSDAHCRLETKLDETLAAANSAVESTRATVVETHRNQQRANELSSQVRARIEKQSERRTAREHDPRLYVVMETVRILEDRP